MVGEALESLRLELGGALEPDAVVAASRSPDAPLHPYFVWDDAVAAGRYRKDQARHLIRCVTVEVPRGVGMEPVETRAFVSVVDEEEERGYTSILVAMADPELRRQVVQTAMRELRVWRERYKSYKELGDLFAAIDTHVDMAA